MAMVTGGAGVQLHVVDAQSAGSSDRVPSRVSQSWHAWDNSSHPTWRANFA
jgi:hypothetical protein